MASFKQTTKIFLDHDHIVLTVAKARFQIISIKRNMEMLQPNYQNMLPKHIVNEDKSVFKIVTHDTYHGMMSKAVTDMLATHNVVITSNTSENLAFEEDTLLCIAPLDWPIGVH
ncbi:hypothetical protein DXG01_006818, partial [Tephrocybe rancida]